MTNNDEFPSEEEIAAGEIELISPSGARRTMRADERLVYTRDGSLWVGKRATASECPSGFEPNPNPCYDCGTDTTPCTGKRDCPHNGWEWYEVREDVWDAAGMTNIGGRAYLCIGCLEQRIGRRLTAGDFAPVPINKPNPRDTDRVASRKAPKRAYGYGADVPEPPRGGLHDRGPRSGVR
jgi:hypothetical protein